MRGPVGYRVVGVVLLVLVAGCGGPGPSDTPTPTEIRSSPATDAPTTIEETGTTATATVDASTPGATLAPTPTATATPSPTRTRTPASPSPTPTSTPTATPTPTSTPTATPTPTPTRTPPRSERTEFRVEVVEVVDGDTLEVEYSDGETETVRLLGVDTPEVHTATDPAEWSGVPDTEAGREHLRDWGHKASEYARTELDRGEEIRIVVDPAADRRGSYGRLLAYVYDDGDLFNLQLLRQGYARMYDTEFGERSRFADAEATARANDVGVWGFEGAAATPTATRTATPDGDADGDTAGGALSVARIHEDARGNDHENLNDEYVVFENAGDEPLDLSGWEVRDDADHTYRFPEGFTLAPGETVTLYTGSGEDTATELYWGSGRAIWNNGGDTVYVYDAEGSLRIERSYS